MTKKLHERLQYINESDLLIHRQCRILSKAVFMETDTTYNENCVLPWILNATVFDYTTMHWAAIAIV